jgi:DNA modification methylase
MKNIDLFGNEVEERGSLKDTYIVPPFSILDTTQGDWFNRKNIWKNLGIKSELGRDAECVPSVFGKDEEEYFKKYGRKPMSGTSIFDPVLCEIMYSWFVKKEGSILDPFAGGSVRGVVAHYLDYKYTGIELREEQVDANVQQGIDILPENPPTWLCGDSNQVLNKIDREFDFVFSCPPYYDLEVYCDDPNDLSNMSYNEFNEVYESIINKSCKLLRNNRFACFVVGNCRDKSGYMMDLVGTTIRAFEKAGLKFYNDIVLKNAYGTAMLRASNTMTYKKVVKVHQNVLVFCKGSPKYFKG